MRINFYKYQGTGNDFVILDNRKHVYSQLKEEDIRRVCDRRFGVGADGLMLLNEHPDYDFEMIYFNADGRRSSMCGNGGRCLTQFANDVGIVQTTYKFLAIDGEHESEINSDGTVAIKMNDVREVFFDHGNYRLNTGSPHYISFVNDVMNIDVFKKGQEIRYNHEFREQGINVNFVEQTEHKDRIIVRTYERGVENETLSCGTGVTAAALVSFHNDNGFNQVEVHTRGGVLKVEYDKAGNSYSDIWLSGPAVRVFEGAMEINI